MSLSDTTEEILNDFKKNTGILLPITKFIVSNAVLLGVLLVVPFKVLFWIYQIGYLSTFGINYELLIRDSVSAQGLWGELFTSFVDAFGQLILLFLIGFFILFIYGSIKSYYLLHNKVKLFRLKPKITHPECKVIVKRKSPYLRKLKVWCDIGAKKFKSTFLFAYASYFMSALFLIVFILFCIFASYIHDRGKERSELRLNEFLENNLCSDGWGQSGCYKVTKGSDVFEGNLVAMNENSIYLMTKNELLILPKGKDVLISRNFIKKAKTSDIEEDNSGEESKTY